MHWSFTRQCLTSRLTLFCLWLSLQIFSYLSWKLVFLWFPLIDPNFYLLKAVHMFDFDTENQSYFSRFIYNRYLFHPSFSFGEIKALHWADLSCKPVPFFQGSFCFLLFEDQPGSGLSLTFLIGKLMWSSCWTTSGTLILRTC